MATSFGSDRSEARNGTSSVPLNRCRMVDFCWWNLGIGSGRESHGTQLWQPGLLGNSHRRQRTGALATQLWWSAERRVDRDKPGARRDRAARDV